LKPGTSIGDSLNQMLISEKIKLLFSEELLIRADHLYRESGDGSFREKAVELVQALLPLAPGMNGAARLGESDLDYLTAVLELAVAIHQLKVCQAGEADNFTQMSELDLYA
jgi:hypothetical protein